MNQTGLSKECKDLEIIIDNLKNGKEKCDISDTQYSLEDVIEYLNGFLSELIELNDQISEQGNTPEILEKVFNKYTELWLFQLSFNINSLPRVIGGLLNYPNREEKE